MFSPSEFRRQFPEFSDPGLYSDPVLGFWSGIAGALLNTARWGELLDQGVSLFVAHHLTVARRNEDASAAGGTPGEVKGPLTSRSVDKVSNSWDASQVSMTDAGFWNMSSYGIRFYQLARMTGAGGIQL